MAEIHSMDEVKETTTWLQELLQKERANGIMSRSTEERIEDMVKTYTEIAEMGTVTPEQHGLLKRVREEVNRLLESDEKYYEHRIKLEAIWKNDWYLRHAEYFAWAALELPDQGVAALDRAARKAAEEAAQEAIEAGQDPNTNPQAALASLEDEDAAMKIFLSARWSVIKNYIKREWADEKAAADAAMKILLSTRWSVIKDHSKREQADEKTAAKQGYEKPVAHMCRLVDKLEDMMVSPYHKAAKGFLGSYANSHISVMAEEGDMDAVADWMADDYADLKWETCITDAEREDAYKCIRACMGRYFKRIKIKDGVLRNFKLWPPVRGPNGKFTFERGTGGVLIVDDKKFSLDDYEETETDEGGEVEEEDPYMYDMFKTDEDSDVEGEDA
ncbi:hypothetical protein V8F33_009293 [Rhypophila sp. PSN 637]